MMGTERDCGGNSIPSGPEHRQARPTAALRGRLSRSSSLSGSRSPLHLRTSPKTFGIVPLNDIGGEARLLADEPPAPVEPARAPEPEPLESWTPATPVALVAAAGQRRSSASRRSTRSRFAPPDPRRRPASVAQWFFTGALAGCAVGLLLCDCCLLVALVCGACTDDASAGRSGRGLSGTAPGPARCRPTAGVDTREAIDRADARRRRFAISKHGRRSPRSRQWPHVSRQSVPPSTRRFLSRGTRLPIVRPRLLGPLKP